MLSGFIVRFGFMVEKVRLSVINVKNVVDISFLCVLLDIMRIYVVLLLDMRFMVIIV